MDYQNMKLVDFPSWFDRFRKSPYPINLNMLGEPDKLIVAISENTEAVNIDDDCIIVPIGHCGGTIVGFPESITLFSFTSRATPPTWEHDLILFLNDKGLNAEICGNDILVDGYKIAGSMSKWISNDIQFYGIHISINCDSERIDKICQKPMVKIPRGLSEYEVQRNDVLHALGIEGPNSQSKI